jgi:cephalosporin hydroxylase
MGRPIIQLPEDMIRIQEVIYQVKPDVIIETGIAHGGSTDTQIVNQVKNLVKPGETVLVCLDSCHTKQHVADELEAYCSFVTPGSYIIATDGIMKDLHDVPRGNPEWIWDHPTAAAAEFAEQHPEFLLEQPKWLFSESDLTENVTHWPGAWLRRV